MSQTFQALVNQTPGLLARVDALFRRQDVPLTSLAYDGVRGMPHASTRLLSDIDIMVPRDRIGDAEGDVPGPVHFL